MTLIARALAEEPGLIVMDEPTASLDFGNQARVIERIRALGARGIAVVLAVVLSRPTILATPSPSPAPTASG